MTPRRRYQAVMLLALVGLALALELTVVHYRTHTDADYHALCAVSDRINCESVAMSPYSIWLGVPVSVWGTLCYLAVGALAGWGLSRRSLGPSWPHGLLSVLAVGAEVVSAYLAYVAVRYIDSICIYCTGLYVVNTAWLGLMLVGRFSVRRWAAELQADLGALWQHASLAAVLVLLGSTVVFGLAIGFPRYWLGGVAKDDPKHAEGVTASGEHWIGAADAALTIVEYTDYECPHCRRAHREIRERIARSVRPARLVHKHYPLDQACNPNVSRPFHRRACELSRFVECAGQQGKFWQANDAVFAALDHTRAAALDLAALARELGLDESKLRSCVGDAATAQRVARDLADGSALGIRGTPTYLIDGVPYTGKLPASVLAPAPSALPGQGTSRPQGSS